MSEPSTIHATDDNRGMTAAAKLAQQLLMKRNRLFEVWVIAEAEVRDAAVALDDAQSRFTAAVAGMKAADEKYRQFAVAHAGSS